MAAKEQGKVKVLDKKALKSTRGGIIAVLKSGSIAPESGTTTDAPGVRKAGEKPLEY